MQNHYHHPQHPCTKKLCETMCYNNSTHSLSANTCTESQPNYPPHTHPSVMWVGAGIITHVSAVSCIMHIHCRMYSFFIAGTQASTGCKSGTSWRGGIILQQLLVSGCTVYCLHQIWRLTYPIFQLCTYGSYGLRKLTIQTQTHGSLMHIHTYIFMYSLVRVLSHSCH